MSKNVINLTGILFIITPFIANAESPLIQSGSPIIYLANNLDEKDKLGWCIDTKGRGFSELLHAHSCKPDNGKASDTQFSYDKASSQIRSVAYQGKCAVLNKPEDKVNPFGLIDCNESDPTQKFSYVPSTMEIQLMSDNSKCLLVGNSSKSAGPFMSRALIYAKCQSVEAKYKQWVIKE